MSSNLNRWPVYRNKRGITLLGTVFALVTAIAFSNNVAGAEQGPQIANPASQFCIQSGGALSIKTDNDGGQYGVCTLDDGQQCEEWALMRGECGAAMGVIRNPYAYCAVVGSRDIVPAGATGGHFPAVLDQAMIKQGLISADVPKAIRQKSQWRCMDGEVLVCLIGANLPCGEKADVSNTPSPAMLTFCRANPGAETIPVIVTGRATIYAWRCNRESPSVIKQVFSADEQGYLADFWYRMNPLSYAVPGWCLHR